MSEITVGQVIALRGSVIRIGRTPNMGPLYRLTDYNTRTRTFTTRSLYGVESSITLNELHQAFREGIAHTKGTRRES